MNILQTGTEPTRRLIDINVEQLVGIIRAVVTDALREDMQARRDVTAGKAYGIQGLASTLNCSRRTATRIRKTGILDDAIMSAGATLVVDIEKAQRLYRQEVGKRKNI